MRSRLLSATFRSLDRLTDFTDDGHEGSNGTERSEFYLGAATDQACAVSGLANSA